MSLIVFIFWSPRLGGRLGFHHVRQEFGRTIRSEIRKPNGQAIGEARAPFATQRRLEVQFLRLPRKHAPSCPSTSILGYRAQGCSYSVAPVPCGAGHGRQGEEQVKNGDPSRCCAALALSSGALSPPPALNFGDPVHWIQLVKQSVRCIAATEDRAEVESQAVWLLMHEQRGCRQVHDLRGFVQAVVRTALNRTRSKRDCRGIDYGVDPDRLPATPRAARSPLPVTSNSGGVDPFRFAPGRRQRWIVEQALAGSTTAQMAECAGWSDRKMERRIILLAEKIRSAKQLRESRGWREHENRAQLTRPVLWRVEATDG